MPGLTLRLLTSMPRLSSDRGEIAIASKKSLALLAYLAMRRGEPVSRATLASLLWSDRSEAQARQSLRQTLHTLRRELGDAHSALIVDDTSVSLAIESDDVDALHFAKLAESPDPAIQRRCLEVEWRPLLEQFSAGSEAVDEWVTAERHRLDLIAARVFSNLVARLDADGDGERAILALERLLQIDPTIEENHRRLLRVEQRYRGTDAALSRARALAALLKRELDAEPEQATRDLIEAIRSEGESDMQRPALTSPRPSAEAPRVETRVKAPAQDVSAWRNRAMAIAASIAVIAVGAVAYSLNPQTTAPPPAPTAQVLPAPAPEPSWQSPGAPSKAAELSGQGLVAIAVRPFEHHAPAGSEAELLSAVISDDLTGILSRIPSFRVISQRTMDSYRGRQVDDAVVGAELGVRYLVEGSITLRDGVLRMNVTLADTRTRLTVWSRRFERPNADHQATLDEIVTGLGRELHFEVTRTEGAANNHDQDAHALIFKGWAAMDRIHKDGKRALQEAEAFFNKALERDPGNPRAQVGVAAVHTHLALQLLVDDPTPHLAKAEKILQDVSERAPNRSDAHHVVGLINVARRNPQAAMQAFERVIELNPSHAGAHAQYGRLLTTSGKPSQGLEYIEYAKRLSPRDPSIAYWHAFSGYAKLELRRFDEAITDTKLALSIMPWQPRTVLLLVSALSMAGQDTEARRVLAELQQAQPHLSNANLLESYGNAKMRHLAINQGMLRLLGASTSAPN